MKFVSIPDQRWGRIFKQSTADKKKDLKTPTKIHQEMRQLGMDREYPSGIQADRCGNLCDLIPCGLQTQFTLPVRNPLPLPQQPLPYLPAFNFSLHLILGYLWACFQKTFFLGCKLQAWKCSDHIMAQNQVGRFALEHLFQGSGEQGLDSSPWLPALCLPWVRCWGQEACVLLSLLTFPPAHTW